MKEATTSTRLKQIMSSLNLRQVDILERTQPLCAKYDIKMNKSDISQYVSGKAEPNQDKLFVLSLALNVSEGWLMGFDVPKARVSSSSESTSQGERNILTLYNQLDDVGKVQLAAYAEGLLASQISNNRYSSMTKAELAADAEREVNRIVADEVAKANKVKVSAAKLSNETAF